LQLHGEGFDLSGVCSLGRGTLRRGGMGEYIFDHSELLLNRCERGFLSFTCHRFFSSDGI